jgi:hypothetical protein
MNTETGHNRGRVSETHGCQVKAVRGQVVGGLGQFFRRLDKLATTHHVSVRVINGHIETQGLGPMLYKLFLGTLIHIQGNKHSG